MTEYTTDSHLNANCIRIAEELFDYQLDRHCSKTIASFSASIACLITS